MSSAELDLKLQHLFGSQGWRDPTWLNSLEEFDEVPLFFRNADVAFLGALPFELRQRMVVEAAIRELDNLAAAIESLENPAMFFACLTFKDWVEVHAGHRVVATPALFVSPKWNIELPSPLWKSPNSADALMVARSTSEMSRRDLCVAEDATVGEANHSQRIYLGYVHDQNRFRSVGDYSFE